MMIVALPSTTSTLAEMYREERVESLALQEVIFV